MDDLLTTLLERPDIALLGIAVLAIGLTAGMGAALALGAFVTDRLNRARLSPHEQLAAGAPELRSELEQRRAIMPHRSAGPGAAIFTLALIVVGLAVGAFVRLMPVAASVGAQAVDALFNTMLGVAAAIFVLVEFVIIFVAIRFRRKQGDSADGLPIHGSNRLEIAWTVIPVLIVLWLGAVSVQTLGDIQQPAPPAETLTIEVTARQFQFEFYYPELDRRTQDLFVPTGKPVRLLITSADVLHSFWAPAFRIKQDALQLVETEVTFTADTPGAYPIRCAELCGVGHGRMGFTNQVMVLEPEAYRQWEAQTGAPPSVAPAELFATYGCAACHTLDTVGATGQVGPDLNAIGALAAERQAGSTAEEYIRASILTPSAYVVEGFPPNVMPGDFGERMSDAELDAIVQFLLEQN